MVIARTGRLQRQMYLHLWYSVCRFCSAAVLLIVQEVQMFTVVKSKPNWTYRPDDAKLIFIFTSTHPFPFLILFPLFCNFSLPLLFHYVFIFFLFPPAGIGRVILCDVFSYKTRQMCM
jgi:hypothetical protein